MNKNKNVLLIMPKYYEYEKQIKKHIINNGNKVRIIYENIDDISYIDKYMIYKSKNYDKYYRKKIYKINRDTDYVIVINGSTISVNILNEIKRKVKPDCRFVYYLWDSVCNCENSLFIYNFFDRVITFDPKDAKKFGWEYRPLFFCKRNNKEIKKDIDILFICSLHSKRIELLNKISEISKTQGYYMYSYVYRRFIGYIKHKYIEKKNEYINANNYDVKHIKLSLSKTYKLYERSKVVIDYSNPSQNGLTIRSIESFGNNCKLITNNANIKNEKFYNPNNVYIYNKISDIKIDGLFINSDYNKIDEEIYNYYSIEAWINNLMKEE